uniref:Uncharacterized protein n=1 Tax=Arundo donax TaxID=35708 RepID=A0A0A9C2K1_ARUDO
MLQRYIHAFADFICDRKKYQHYGDRLWNQKVLGLVGQTEYMRCGFSTTRHEEEEEEVSLDGQVVLQKDTFRYLGSMLQEDGDIDEDVSHRIKVG